MPTAEEDYGLLSQHLLRFPDNPRGAPSTPGLAEAEEGFWSNEGACARPPALNLGSFKRSADVSLFWPSPPPSSAFGNAAVNEKRGENKTLLMFY